MDDFFSNIEVSILVLATFILLIIFLEIGFRWGLIFEKNKEKKVGGLFYTKMDENAPLISTSSLALLALLLGFAFSSAMENFEQNKRSVIDEAAKINAAYSFVDLLPKPYTQELSEKLREYLTIRLELSQFPRKESTIKDIQQRSYIAQQNIWQYFKKLCDKDPQNELNLMVATSIVEMISAENTRTELILSAVPIGLFLPLVIFLAVNALLLGVSLGKTENRHIILSWGLFFLVALTVGIIVDLHRPLYGIVHVDQNSMHAIMERLY